MHISEGVLSAPVLLSGAGLAAVGTAIGLKRLDYDRLMTVAVLSAAFFIATLVHVPIGPASAHLILNGLLGVMLGWAAFPAILIALVLQAVLFQYGGLTSLGMNTVTMAFPAVLCWYIFRRYSLASPKTRSVAAFFCGFLSVLGAALLTTLALAFTDEGFVQAARVLVIGHLPVMIVEGLITAFIISFLAKVRPEILTSPA